MPALEQDSQRRIQLLKQTNPNVFPDGAQPLVMTTLSLKRQTPDQARTDFRPMGYNARAWGALLRHYESFSGDVSPDYEQIDLLLEMLCGAPVVTAETVSVDGVDTAIQRRDYYVPESLISAITFYAIEHGYARACKRMLYSLLASFGLNVKRGNQPSIAGSATLMFNKPLKNADGTENFLMSGAVAANAIHALSGENIAGDVVLAVSVAGGAAQNVTLSPGDNAAAIDAKITALGNVDAVTVTGDGIVASSGGGFVFSNAGNPAVDGTYVEDGVFNGRPFYHTDTQAVSWSVSESQWLSTGRNGQAPIGGIQYRNADDTPAPTLTGWVQGNAALPAPTVASVGGSVAHADATIEFTGPANTSVTATKVLGINYTIAPTQAGSDGNIVKPDPWPMLPQHFSVRRSATLAGLTAATPLNGVHETDLQISSIVEPDQDFDEGNLGYNDHVGADIVIKNKLVLVSDELEATSNCRDLLEKSEEEPARAEWYRVRGRHADKLHSMLYEGFFSLSEPYAPSAGGKVFQYEFPMELQLNNELKTPGGEPAIMRISTTRPA